MKSLVFLLQTLVSNIADSVIHTCASWVYFLWKIIWKSLLLLSIS